MISIYERYQDCSFGDCGRIVELDVKGGEAVVVRRRRMTMIMRIMRMIMMKRESCYIGDIH